jgi:hypothetical protein
MVVEAVRTNTFWLPTNDNVNEYLVRRASDPDGFAREVAAELAG